MSDVIETLRKIKSRAFYSHRADLLYTELAHEVEHAMVEAVTEIERLRAELAEHDRRAALVTAWAEGLKAGKRYEDADGLWFAASYPDWVLEGEPQYCVDSRIGTDHGCRDADPARAAAYMLAVSDEWQEVEP